MSDIICKNHSDFIDLGGLKHKHFYTIVVHSDADMLDGVTFTGRLPTPLEATQAELLAKHLRDAAAAKRRGRGYYASCLFGEPKVAA